MAARRVSEPGDVNTALREAIQSGAPNLVEVIVADGFENSRRSA